LPWLQRRQVAVASVNAIATIVSPSATIALAPSPAGVAVPSVSWIEVSLWIVLAGIVLRLARMGYRMIRLRRVRRSGRIALAGDVHDELQKGLGTRAEIRYVGDGQPVTFGVWRPVVLLPERLMSHSPEIQRAVLVHELLHVRRRDWIWVMGEELVRAV